MRKLVPAVFAVTALLGASSASATTAYGDTNPPFSGLSSAPEASSPSGQFDMAPSMGGDATAASNARDDVEDEGGGSGEPAAADPGDSPAAKAMEQTPTGNSLSPTTRIEDLQNVWRPGP